MYRQEPDSFPVSQTPGPGPYFSLPLVTKSLVDLFLIILTITFVLFVDPFPVVFTVLSSVISDMFLVLLTIGSPVVDESFLLISYHLSRRVLRISAFSVRYCFCRTRIFSLLLRSTKWNANLILLRDYAELVALCKVIVWKTHIPVRTQK